MTLINQIPNLVGIHDYCDEQGKDDVNEEWNKCVDVDRPKNFDNCTRVADCVEGGEHVIPIEQWK